MARSTRKSHPLKWRCTRLEHGTRIIISKHTNESASPDRFAFEILGAVRGQGKPATVYRIDISYRDADGSVMATIGSAADAAKARTERRFPNEFRFVKSELAIPANAPGHHLATRSRRYFGRSSV